jgi:hypothetical protein
MRRSWRFVRQAAGGSEPLRRGHIDNVFHKFKLVIAPGRPFRPYSRFLRDGVTAALALQAARQ